MRVNERGHESQAQRWLFMPGQGAHWASLPREPIPAIQHLLLLLLLLLLPSPLPPPRTPGFLPHCHTEDHRQARQQQQLWDLGAEEDLSEEGGEGPGPERSQGSKGARGLWRPTSAGPGRPQEEGAAMALDPPRVSVKSRVSAFEGQQESQGCGCCLLPDSRDPRRPRQRGCTSPAHSRDLSPAKPRETPKGCRKLNGRKKEVDKTLVSLLLVLHSGTNSSMIAIDNKIEQAMDLVKSHLMFAVREEVEVLREQIKELSDRNAMLEQENALLRSLASAEQLSRFQAQLHSNAKPPSSGAA